ncbi:MAG: hypothetical protein GX444_07960 [Myxococcales bacterium]|nr:hypothetical protein [Myxococcales bacterium]
MGNHLFILEDRLTWSVAEIAHDDSFAGLNNIQMCLLGGYGYRFGWFSPRVHLGLGGGSWDYVLIEPADNRRVERSYLALTPGIELRANLTPYFFLNAIGGYDYTLGISDYSHSGIWQKSDYDEMNFHHLFFGLNIGGNF